MPLSTVNPIEQIGKISAPVLLLHGDQDEVIMPDQIDKLFKHANSAEKHLVRGKKHSDLFDDPVYKERVVAFFNKVLNYERIY